MKQANWHRQISNQPLFPELIWSRPENRQAAGKLLVIGGNVHSLAAPAGAYQTAREAGIGTARVVLPLAVKRIAGQFLQTVEYAPNTPSGSFSQQALADFLEQAAWADGVLLAGDFGHNSETAMVLEKFIQKFSGPLVITQDAVEYFKTMSELVLSRPDTLLVVSLGQLQKLTTTLGSTIAITSNMDLLRLIDCLHILTTNYPAYIVVKHHETIAVAVDGQISTTKTDLSIWRVKTAARLIVWWLQNSKKPFEALTTAMYSLFDG